MLVALPAPLMASRSPSVVEVSLEFVWFCVTSHSVSSNAANPATDLFAWSASTFFLPDLALVSPGKTIDRSIPELPILSRSLLMTWSLFRRCCFRDKICSSRLAAASRAGTRISCWIPVSPGTFMQDSWNRHSKGFNGVGSGIDVSI